MISASRTLQPTQRLVAGVAALGLAFSLFAMAPGTDLRGARLPFGGADHGAGTASLDLAHFEPNAGQVGGAVDFIARSGSVSALFGARGVELIGKNGVAQVTFPGSDVREIEGLRRLPSVSNYLTGDRSEWQTDVPHYAAVAYRDLYPGIDVIFRDAGQGFEYDVMVAPGASPSLFRLAILDADIKLRNGGVVLEGREDLKQSPPVAYQEVNGAIRRVEADYVLRDGALAIRTGAYDKSLPLVIDPVLTFSTYFGTDGPSDSVTAVSVDADENVYVAGGVDAPQPLPATDGAFQTNFAGSGDAFVAKIDPAGQLVYSTYFGGSAGDGAEEIDVGPDGSAYVVGVTQSPDLPTTPGAFQTVLRGDVENCVSHCPHDGFVARLSSDGSDLLYSTFLGGQHDDLGIAIKVDETGDAFVVGMTSSPDFPVTAGAFDETYNEPTCFEILCDQDGFVAKLSADGSELESSTFFGGTSLDSPQDVDLDASGNLYLAGGGFSIDLPTTEGAYQREKNGNGDLDFNGFVASFVPDMSALRYATYLGGRSEDLINSVDVEPSGEAWVAGTGGRGIPVTEDALQATKHGSSDAFVTQFSPDGSSVVYSTFYGGELDDYGHGVEVDDAGWVNLFGSTASKEIDTRRAIQGRNAGSVDLFFTRFKPGADRANLSTYLGSEREDIGTDIAVTSEGSIYLVGSSTSGGFPLAGPYVQSDRHASDGFITRIDSGRTRRVRVADSGLEPQSLSVGVGVAVEWRFERSAKKRHRIMDLGGAALFDSARRLPGSSYHFMLPAGTFRVADPVSGDVQKIRVVPAAFFGEELGTIEVKWARMRFSDDLVFDVQARRGDSPFEMWLEGTTSLGGVLANLPGDDWFRARVRSVETGAASRWSPLASLSEPN